MIYGIECLCEIEVYNVSLSVLVLITTNRMQNREKLTDTRPISKKAVMGWIDKTCNMFIKPEVDTAFQVLTNNGK